MSDEEAVELATQELARIGDIDRQGHRRSEGAWFEGISGVRLPLEGAVKTLRNIFEGFDNLSA